MQAQDGWVRGEAVPMHVAWVGGLRRDSEDARGDQSETEKKGMRKADKLMIALLVGIFAIGVIDQLRVSREIHAFVNGVGMSFEYKAWAWEK